MRGLICCLLLWVADATAAQELRLPSNAVLTRTETTETGHLDLPKGATVEGWLPTLPREGQVSHQSWRIEATDLTTLQILAPLRDQLIAEGWEIVFECETAACGGFDFRRAVTVFPPPEMFVNLGDFRWVSAMRPGEALAIMVSRTEAAGFVQLSRAGPVQRQGALGSADAPAIAGSRSAAAAEAPLPQDSVAFAALLEAQGRVILSDLAFGTGSATLEAGTYTSLVALAEYLVAHPDRRVALVGHTDAEGSLEGNIALSRRRAGSVVERLVGGLGVARGQVEAEGMGYLAPVASNLTEAGRRANRRVEAVLLSTE